MDGRLRVWADGSLEVTRNDGKSRQIWRKRPDGWEMMVGQGESSSRVLQVLPTDTGMATENVEIDPGAGRVRFSRLDGGGLRLLTSNADGSQWSSGTTMAYQVQHGPHQHVTSSTPILDDNGDVVGHKDTVVVHKQGGQQDTFVDQYDAQGNLEKSTELTGKTGHWSSDTTDGSGVHIGSRQVDITDDQHWSTWDLTKDPATGESTVDTTSKQAGELTTVHKELDSTGGVMTSLTTTTKDLGGGTFEQTSVYDSGIGQTSSHTVTTFAPGGSISQSTDRTESVAGQPTTTTHTETQVDFTTQEVTGADGGTTTEVVTITSSSSREIDQASGQITDRTVTSDGTTTYVHETVVDTQGNTVSESQTEHPTGDGGREPDPPADKPEDKPTPDPEPSAVSDDPDGFGSGGQEEGRPGPPSPIPGGGGHHPTGGGDGTGDGDVWDGNPAAMNDQISAWLAAHHPSGGGSGGDESDGWGNGHPVGDIVVDLSHIGTTGGTDDGRGWGDLTNPKARAAAATLAAGLAARAGVLQAGKLLTSGRAESPRTS